MVEFGDMQVVHYFEAWSVNSSKLGGETVEVDGATGL